MQNKRVNPIVQWWVTPKLPYHDIYGLPLLINESFFTKYKHYLSQWLLHPIKRRLARLYIRFLQATTDIKVIAITGSAGKTTTKEMLFSILKRYGKVICTKTFIDPVYNIPNTILSTPFGTKFLILEMGVEYPGEMDFYNWLVKADVGVITNIYPTHLEFLGDLEGVFKEKTKLIKSLRKNGIAVLNRKDRLLLQLERKISSKIIWFGNGTKVLSTKPEFTPNFGTKFQLIVSGDSKKYSVVLPILGFQYIENALAAAAVANHFNVPLKIIKIGLEHFEAPHHRMRIIRHKTGAIIIDDSYNNNPEAAKSSIETLWTISGKKDQVIIFGDMKELGKWEKKYHLEIGNLISKENPKKVICIGEASLNVAKVVSQNLGSEKVAHVGRWKEAIDLIKPYLVKDTYILIKGSRSIGLDKLVERLV